MYYRFVFKRTTGVNCVTKKVSCHLRQFSQYIATEVRHVNAVKQMQSNDRLWIVKNSKKGINMTNINPSNESRLYSIEKASEFLGLKPQQLRRLFYTQYNQLQPVPTRLGHRVYFTEENLVNFVSKHTENPNDNQ